MAVTIEENPHPPNRANFRHFTVRINDIHSISTTVTSSNSVVKQWVKQTLHKLYRTNCLVIGIAIRPTPLLTIQLYVHNYCLIYHIHHAANAPTILRNFLLDPRITFLSLWPRPTMVTRLLACRHSYHLLDNMPIDVRSFLQDKQGNTLKDNDARIYQIAIVVLGFNIQPELQDVEFSDWEVRELTNAEIAQACLDAFVPYDIGIRVNVLNSNRN